MADDNDDKKPPSSETPREPETPATTRDDDTEASASNTARSASVMMDEKAQYRRKTDQKASQPGAFASGGDASAVIASVESDVLAKKMAANPSASASTTTAASNISQADRTVAIETVEADMMAKQKAQNRSASGAATVPGAVSVAGTTASVLSTSDASAAISTVEADLLAKEKAAAGGSQNTGTTQPGAVASGGAASEMIAEGEAIIIAVEEDTAAKEKAGRNTGTTKPGAVAAVGGAVGAAAIISAVEDDAVAKEKAAAFEPAPAIVMEPQVIAAIEEDQLAKLQAQEPPQEQPEALSGPSQNDMEDKIAEMEAEEAHQGYAKDGAYDDDKSIKSGPKDYQVEDMAANDEGLLQATLVDEDAERQALEKGEVFDREKGRPYYREMWFIAAITILVVLCLVGIIVGLVVGLRDDDDGGTPVFTDPPTPSPTPRPTTDYDVALRDWIKANHNISDFFVDYSPEAFDMAIDWYANEDKGLDRTVPIEETLWSIDRFILAWVYFHGTFLGTSPWLSCNPPIESIGEDENCIRMQLAGVSNDLEQNFYVDTPSKRWLSKAHECEWAGITCFTDRFRTEIPGGYEECMYRVAAATFDANGMKNTLPIQMSRLPCLNVLTFLSNDDMTGTIPPELFSWDYKDEGGIFQRIRLERLPKITGTLPDTLFDMKRLVALELGDMSLTGTLPNRFSELPIFGTFHVFGNDQLDFTIPTNATSIRSIRVHRNSNISSIERIPTEIGNLQLLDRLWMFDNNLQGELPSELSNCAKMIDFRVRNNQLTGTLPNYNWPDLANFDLANNRLEGPLPPSFNRLPERLQNFYLANNRFNGTLDPGIATSCGNLRRFEVDNNEFTGPIPDFSSCPQLNTFEVNLNKFEGEVPFDICKLKTSDGLTILNADCLAYPPQNECKCCTACCDSSTRVCEASVSSQLRQRQLRHSKILDEDKAEESLFWNENVFANEVNKQQNEWTIPSDSLGFY